MKCAFITGISGQDGSYLAELLLSKKIYTVFGLVRRSSNPSNLDRVSDIKQNLNLRYGDVTDFASISSVLQEISTTIRPLHCLEIYNLAAQSDVAVSFSVPSFTMQVNLLGILNILDCVKSLPVEIKKLTRIYQASSSEQFGRVTQIPQSEITPFFPQSPYGVSKTAAFQIVKNYRESFQLFACSGILFNHESPRRGNNFVTKKIVEGVKKLAVVPTGSFVLKLGNLDARRDWGHARDYVRAMWLILQQPEPKDLVIATGTQISVREFATRCLEKKGFDVEWRGVGLEEVCIDKRTRHILIQVDRTLFRPSEVDTLLGDPSLARSLLGWTPEISLDLMIDEMLHS